jgi:hypothetical protein
MWEWWCVVGRTTARERGAHIFSREEDDRGRGAKGYGRGGLGLGQGRWRRWARGREKGGKLGQREEEAQGGGGFRGFV